MFASRYSQMSQNLELTIFLKSGIVTKYEEKALVTILLK